MDKKEIQDGICCLLMYCIVSIIFLIICVIANNTGPNTLYPIIFKILPIINMISWLSILYLFTKSDSESSIVTRIVITILSIALVCISFAPMQVLSSSVSYLLDATLLVNYFFYLLEYTKW